MRRCALLAVLSCVLAAPAADARERLVSFAHLTDLHLTDEASPARHEQLFDSGKRAFGAFWRPQEAFGPQVADQVVRAVNREQVGFALVTGDIADNAQVNEVRWGVRILDGGRVDPYSGKRVTRRSGTCRAPVAALRRLNRIAAARGYTGVQDPRDWPRAAGDRHAAYPSLEDRWPGALDRAQQPFVAEGLRVPWFSARGNHDALPQGHYGPARVRPRSVATGCRKVFPDSVPSPATHVSDPWAELRRRLPSAGLVPPDPRRRFIASAAEFRRLHGRADRRHGFGFASPAELRRSRGAALYYAWSPRPELRFVALDTAADAGGNGGNLDHPQFRWLRGELRRARRRNQLVVVYGHHPIEMMGNRAFDEITWRFDRDPRDSRPLHHGQTGPASVRSLLLRFPNVILYVAGHRHYHRVTPYLRAENTGFWQVVTASLIGAPQQARTIEIADNEDGTLSIVTRPIDHDARAAPPPGPAADMDSGALAAIGRELAFGVSAGRAAPPIQELLLMDPRR